jgi:hypothetical protein
MKRFILNLILVLIVPISAYSQTITRVKIGPLAGLSESKLESTSGTIPTYSYGLFMVMDRVGLEIKKVKPFNYQFPKLMSDNFYTDFDGTTYTLNYNLYTGSSVSFAWGGGIYVEDYQYVQIPTSATKGRQISYFGTFDMMFDLTRRSGFSLGGELGYQYKSVNLGLYINL